MDGGIERMLLELMKVDISGITQRMGTLTGVGRQVVFGT